MPNRPSSGGDFTADRRCPSKANKQWKKQI